MEKQTDGGLDGGRGALCLPLHQTRPSLNTETPSEAQRLTQCLEHNRFSKNERKERGKSGRGGEREKGRKAGKEEEREKGRKAGREG